MDGLIIGLALPFIGTALGAACVLFMKNRMPQLLQKGHTGFAAGVMVAASAWSFLIPSMEMTGKPVLMSVIPDIVGFALGIGFLLLLDVTVPHQHIDEMESEGSKSNISRTKTLVFAVTLHKFPKVWLWVWR